MKKRFAVIALMSLSPLAQAEFIHGDLASQGDNNIVMDANTGFVWAKYTETGGKSISDWGPDEFSSGTFEGFRVATKSEVFTLFSSIFGVSDYAQDYASLGHGRSTHYGDFFYSATSRQNASYAVSSVIGPNQYNEMDIKYYSDDKSEARDAYINTGVGSFSLNGISSLDTKAPAHRVFLVSNGGHSYSYANDESFRAQQQNARQAYIASAPMSVGAVSIGLLGLARLKRRKS
jgi:hypothetical protein